jgi:hypothetical protein
MYVREQGAFLSHLVTGGKVSSSTRNQVRCSLPMGVSGTGLRRPSKAEPARKSRRIPVALTEEEEVGALHGHPLGPQWGAVGGREYRKN